VKSVSLYIERFQRYGVLKNVQLFGQPCRLHGGMSVRKFRYLTQIRLPYPRGQSIIPRNCDSATADGHSPEMLGARNTLGPPA